MGNKIFFDLLSGASGDMLNASLIDLGFPLSNLKDIIAQLKVPDITIHASKEIRNGIQCTKFDVSTHEHHPHRHLSDLLEIVDKANFDSTLTQNVAKVLDRLAEAESKVHGIEKDHVHFHEIGAVDTIVDIVGFCAGLSYFNADCVFSSLTDGYGTVKTAHGVMPVPVPATVKLAEGFHCTRVSVQGELLTPTGCALLTTLGTQSLHGVNGKYLKTGYSCGNKQFENHPNLLRATLIDTNVNSNLSDTQKETIFLLETDMDHISGEIMGFVSETLLNEGCLDCSWIPLFMKKNRPGYRLSVMTNETKCDSMIDIIMQNTRTLGIRIQKIERIVSQRVNLNTNFLNSQIDEKSCTFKGHTFTKIEYESLAKIARSSKRPILDILEEYLSSKKR